MRAQDPLERKRNEVSEQQPQPITTAADLILYYLEQIGVEYVFGIPGGAIEPLYDALARSQRYGGIKPIVARHESGAAFMADGYARESGKLGVCCATTGPGATNMLTGVASAYMDHTPLLVITGQTSLPKFGRGAFQESSCTGINTVAMYQHCTLYSTFISHIDQIERKLITAISIAKHPPYGPVHISIPYDVLCGAISVDPTIKLKTLLSTQNNVDTDAIERLCRTLCSAHKVVFILGSKAKEATGLILELAILLKAQVATTPDGKGLVSSFHPQFRGVYGLGGHSTAESVLTDKSIDILLSIGTNLDEYSTNCWSQSILLSEKMVFIDTTPIYFSRAPMARLHLSGNLTEIFKRLLIRFSGKIKKGINVRSHHQEVESSVPIIPFERRANRRRCTYRSRSFEGVSYLPMKERRQKQDRRLSPANVPIVRYFKLNDEEKYLSTSTPIKPQRLMYDLSRLFPANTKFLADIGNCVVWAIHYLHPANRSMIGERPNSDETIKLGIGFCSMGWGMGASIGTALACDGNPVVCIVGDGALLMSGQELTTAVQEKLPIIFVVLNDAALGTVKHGQQLGEAEPIAFTLPNINFASVAKALGADGYEIYSPQDMANLDVTAMCKRQGPTLLDVHIDPNEVPPLDTRINMLKK